ncbi:tn7-like transposition protein D [Brevibacillus laterosporus GI-9]|uniref:TnsD family Tn7-like transposition protein n=1 Tax=Brevibacillus laterosporus TaxID=1465 RepID=UPI00024054B7|nr:TnsD family Tn7-like transposition protein [Brevibacillus laterosporus]CCF16894.1 tn7-like transposition protein D [Brevibacillus laterosporus GI-9]
MLSFFPDPYPDELLYSVFARYHLRSGNVSLKATLHDLFGSGAIISSLDISSHLDSLCRRLPKGSVYSPDGFIDNHSLLPFYTPFLPEARFKKIRDMIKGDQGNSVHMTIGIMAGGVCQKNRLYYCKECILEDVQAYGEPYWHRIHHTPGVFVCPIHHSPLSMYPMDQMNRHGFIACPLSVLDSHKQEFILENYDSLSPKTKEMIINIALDTQKLYTKQLPILYEARAVYLPQLKNLQFATPSGRVRQELLHQRFEKYFGNELLTLLESTIEGEYSWLSFATRKTNRSLHPIRHLLLIRFLFGTIENLFRRNIVYHPFGEGLWPCLNRAADHYLKRVIDDCNVAICSDTRRPVGTFTCDCGFVFSRRGPDNSEQDHYRIGRIKEFGNVWLSLLCKKLKDESLSFRQIARDLGVDPNTVIKYSKLLHTEKVSQKVSSTPSELNKAKHNAPITILTSFKKPRNYVNNRVNWELRDLEISVLIEAECKKMLLEIDAKPVRITVSKIGKRIGKLGLLQKHIRKLPVTMSLLIRYSETIEQFQVRRVRWAVQFLHNKNERILRWKIERIAGLRPGYSHLVSDEIQAQILQYRYEAPITMTLRDGGESTWIH